MIKQGSGLVDAENFVNTKTTISTGYFNLGIQTSGFSQTIKITITNDNDQDVTYNLKHAPATTVLSKTYQSVLFHNYQPYVYDTADVLFGQTKITVPKKSKKEISVQITTPNNIHNSYSPIYQGQVQITGSNGDHVSSSYIAVVSDSFRIWTEEREPVIVYDPIYGKVLTSSGSSESNPIITYSTPSLLYLPTLFGSSAVQLLLVQESFNLSSAVIPPVTKQSGVIEAIQPFPVSDIGRSPSGLYIRLPISSSVPSGKYRFFLSAMPAIPGDVDSKEDWQLYLSPPFSYDSGSSNRVVKRSPEESNNADTADTSSSSSSSSSSSTDTLSGFKFSNPSVGSWNTNDTANISPFDTFKITIPYIAYSGFNKGDNVTMRLPSQFTSFPPPFKVLDSSGSDFLEVTIDNKTNIMSVVGVSDDLNSNAFDLVSGTIVFSAFLDSPNDYIGNYVHNQVLLVFDSKYLTLSSSYNVLDLAEVGELNFPSTASYVDISANKSSFEVFLPLGFNDWEDVKVDLSINTPKEDDVYQFQCSSIQVLEISEWDNVYGGTTVDYKPNSETLCGSSTNSQDSNAKAKSVTVSITKPITDTKKGLRISVPISLPSSGLVSMLPVYGRIYGKFENSEFSFNIANNINNVALPGYPRSQGRYK